jgi:hypothetical protein
MMVNIFFFMQRFVLEEKVAFANNLLGALLEVL